MWLQAEAATPVGVLLRHGSRCRRSSQRLRAQEAVLSHHELLQRFLHILDEMEAVSHLYGTGSTSGAARGVCRSTVAADDLYAGMPLEPHSQSLGLAVRQQINDTMLLQVNENGAVTLPTAESEVIHPEHARRHRARSGSLPDTPE